MAKTRKSQYFKLLNRIGVRSVTAKLARPQMMTETAVPCARAEVGKISVGISQIVASQPMPN